MKRGVSPSHLHLVGTGRRNKGHRYDPNAGMIVCSWFRLGDPEFGDLLALTLTRCITQVHPYARPQNPQTPVTKYTPNCCIFFKFNSRAISGQLYCTT
jgi:hypothetical protein